MKNKIYYLGILTIIVITLGCLFKIYHLAGAGILITLGLLGFSLLFLPLAIGSLFRSEDNRRQRIFYLLTGIVLVMHGISILFKIMHWPGSGPMLLITLPLPFVVLLPYFMFMNPNEKRINYTSFLAILFFFAYVSVISSLLATGVSTNITGGFIRSAMDLQKKSALLQEFAGKGKDMAVKDVKTAKLNDSLSGILLSRADLVCIKIEAIRIEMINRFSGNPDEVHRTDLMAIKQRDARVFADTGLFAELDKNLASYSLILESGNFCSDDLKSFAKETFGTVSFLSEGYPFEDLILVAALERLNRLEYEVRLAEVEAIVGMAIQ